MPESDQSSSRLSRQQRQLEQENQLLGLMASMPTEEELKDSDLKKFNLRSKLQFNVMHALGCGNYAKIESYTADTNGSFASGFKNILDERREKFESMIKEEGLVGWKLVVEIIVQAFNEPKNVIH